ncbi:MAG: hypothetical protein MHM6MM_002840 [Cercozoa sp. M6MM]
MKSQPVSAGTPKKKRVNEKNPVATQARDIDVLDATLRTFGSGSKSSVDLDNEQGTLVEEEDVMTHFIFQSEYDTPPAVHSPLPPLQYYSSVDSSLRELRDQVRMLPTFSSLLGFDVHDADSVLDETVCDSLDNSFGEDSWSFQNDNLQNCLDSFEPIDHSGDSFDAALQTQLSPRSSHERVHRQHQM